MCGHIGVFRTKYNVNTAKHQDIFGTMLFTDFLRGQDSTGVAIVHSSTIAAGGELKEHTYKKALGSPDYMQLAGYAKCMSFNRPVVMLGHNRAATRGSVTDINAHPFTAGKIILAHNGTLTNKAQLPDHAMCDTDSEVVANMLNTMTPEEVMNQMEGAWALVWWNTEDKTLNFLRNAARTFYYTTIEEGSTLMWASNDSMLRWGAEHNKTKLDGEDVKNYGATYLTEVNSLYTFSEGSTEPEITKLTMKEKPRYSYDHHRQKYQQSTNNRKKSENAKASEDTKEKLINTILGGMLGKQIPFKQTACHQTNSSDMRHMCVIGKLIQEYSQRIFPEFSHISVGVSGVSKLSLREVSAKHDTIWLGTLKRFSIAGNTRCINLFFGNISPFPNFNVKAEIDFLSEEEALPKKLEVVKGPGGVYIPCTDYKIMSSCGCTRCNKEITLDMAEDLMWVDGEYPVCKSCKIKDLSGMSGEDASVLKLIQYHH